MNCHLPHFGYSITALIDTQTHEAEVAQLKIAKGQEALRKRRYRKQYEIAQAAKANLDAGFPNANLI